MGKLYAGPLSEDENRVSEVENRFCCSRLAFFLPQILRIEISCLTFPERYYPSIIRLSPNWNMERGVNRRALPASSIQ